MRNRGILARSQLHIQRAPFFVYNKILQLLLLDADQVEDVAAWWQQCSRDCLVGSIFLKSFPMYSIEWMSVRKLVSEEFLQLRALGALLKALQKATHRSLDGTEFNGSTARVPAQSETKIAGLYTSTPVVFYLRMKE
jgi:hypothetical protein